MFDLLQGDCLEILKTLPDESVDCCVTSPPYYGLRDYQTALWVGGDESCDHKTGRFTTPHSVKQGSNQGSGDMQAKDVCPKCGATRIDLQIGLEQSPEEYVAKMVEVFSDVKRVLRKDGTCWLNLGDSYWGANGNYSNYSCGPNGIDKNRDVARPEKNSRFSKWNSDTNDSIQISHRTAKNGLHTLFKPKDLIGIPWRVAFALQADGWYLRQDIIWAKGCSGNYLGGNVMPESVKDRCTKSHEYIFLLTKSQKYYFDNKSIKEPVSPVSVKRAEYSWDCDRPSTKNGSIHTEKMGDRFVSDKRNRRSVWVINPKPFKDAHFATFPPELIRPCILAGCPEEGTVLDPFNGAGTTGLVAKQNNRNYIGIELNPEYIEMSRKRIAEAQLQLRMPI